MNDSNTHHSKSRSKLRDRRRSTAGFTLLEVMIAFGLLAIGALGATAGQVLAMKNSTTSQQQTLAMDLAEQQIEIFRIMSGTDVLALPLVVGYPDDPANPIDPDPNDGFDMEFDRRWFITPDSPEPDVIAITVEVDYTNALGNLRTIRLQTLKADL